MKASERPPWNVRGNEVLPTSRFEIRACKAQLVVHRFWSPEPAVNPQSHQSHQSGTPSKEVSQTNRVRSPWRMLNGFRLFDGD